MEHHDDPLGALEARALHRFWHEFFSGFFYLLLNFIWNFVLCHYPLAALASGRNWDFKLLHISACTRK